MFQEFTFIKFSHRNFISILIIFSIFTSVKAQVQTQPSLFTVGVEKGCFTSFDLAYSSKIQPEIKIRDITLDFTQMYIWKKNLIFTYNVPFGYSYKFLSPKSQELFAMGNIYFVSSYRFERRNSFITSGLGFLFPTLSKLSGDLEIEEGNKIFGIGPDISISKVSDPILSNLKFSFVYPLWSKEKDEKIFLKSVNIGTDFHFLINEKFSYILGLDLNIGKEFEKYMITNSMGYFSTPDKEWRLSFSNIFTGLINESAIILSFNIRR